MEIKNIDYKLVGSYKFLDAWDFYSERLDQILGVTAAGSVSLGQVKQQDEVRRLAPQTRVALSAKLDEATARRAQEQLRQQQEQLLRQQQEQRQQLEGRKREMALLATKSVLGIFNQYLLPLMYGLLGSLAYILRTLTREIHDVTYTQDSNVGYRLRWPLGMLAGVTIGWFFDPDALEGAASITPLGLAFLAGYSVELLFTGLDRIVGAFTGPQGQVKGPAGA
jgi:hypothetical protein